MNKKKEVKKEKIEASKSPRDMVEVDVEYIFGQSMYPRQIFKGKYYAISKDTMAKSISETIHPYFGVGGGGVSNFFIDSNDDILKQRLIAEIIRRYKTLDVSDKKHIPGADWGFNITIRWGRYRNEKS